MKKILIFGLILILAVVLFGCKIKKDIGEPKPTELVVSGVMTNAECYLSENLVCINQKINPDYAIIRIKNLLNITLGSAYVVMGDCKSDKIDVEDEKIVSFALNNCPDDGEEDKEFSIHYLDDDGEIVTVKGTIDT